MPISVTCSGCSQKLKAKDEHAGRTLACPKCRAKIVVPAPAADDDVARYLLADDAPRAESKAEEPEPAATPLPSPAAARARGAGGAKPTPVIKPITMTEPPVWLRHLHWALIAALLPLAVSLLGSSDDEGAVIVRILRTLEKSPPDSQVQASRVLKEISEGKASFERLFEVLPDHRLDGAFLPRGSGWPWFFAILSAAAFLAFIRLLSSYKTEDSNRVFILGAFTATIGVFFLFAVQFIANATNGLWIRGNIFVMIFFYIVKFIGFSYQAALDPDSDFLLSFVGFTCGVGFCEEVCKAVPLLWHYRNGSDQGWRDAFIWGLASGAGFGISEGIIYSSDFYNGISGGGIYIVRFVSCVALHALWTGSVAITIQQKQHLLLAPEAWYMYIPPLVLVVGVPMVLHGLYDTLLKKEMPGFALLTALASFGFLAFQISRLHGRDDDAERAKMLRRYEKARKKMA